MKKNFILILFSLFALTNLTGQQKKNPKLLVGIIVDQMREEYLYRFYGQYSENGFKRLMNEGFNCRNLHYNYIPTVTGPGHTSVYAGTTPGIHGIISNDWYDRKLKHSVYCVDDTAERLVGSEDSKKGASPRNLIPTNISDELKICTNQNAKVIGISLKDRAAVLPAGHMANAAYWLDLKSGNFISSTYYMKKLPDWVSAFNDEKEANKFYESSWKLLLPEKDYPLSMADDNPYEGTWIGRQKPVFPYNLRELAQKNPPYFEVLYSSPFGDDLLTDFSIKALEKEDLGKGACPDLLAISYSSPDAVGHKFGPLSREINDTYLRLHADIARLLDALDKFVGKGNYTVFLTADHGVAEVPQYLADHNVPAGYIDNSTLNKEASEYLNSLFGTEKWIESMMNGQFYLDKTLINAKGLSLTAVENQLASFIRDKDGIARVFTAEQLYQQEFTYYLASEVQNGYNYKRSGDVIFITDPGWTDTNSKTGTTHSSGYAYDTHVPMLWYGCGISKGESFVRYNITDIAPTISALLDIKLPGACTGNPIVEALKK